jgi:hypothetical protein
VDTRRIIQYVRNAERRRFKDQQVVAGNGTTE